MRETSEWVTLCRRTNDPKLRYIERTLAARGIPSRRRGYSWHAPILEVPEAFESDAWNLLATRARSGLGLPVRYGVTLDDVPDDHKTFQEG